MARNQLDLFLLKVHVVPLTILRAVFGMGLGLALSLAVAAEGEAIQVRVVADDEAVPGTVAILEATPVVGDAHRKSPEVSVSEIEVPGGIELNLERGFTWRLKVKAAGLWAPETLMVGGSELPAEIQIRMVATSTLTARVETPEDLEEPEGLNVRLRSPSQAAGAAGAIDQSLECPVNGGQWRCEVPSGVFDLRLRSAGFISHYLWERELPARQTLDLGVVKLAPGSSISGWLVTADDSPLDEKTRVVAAPRATHVGSPREQERQAGLALETAVSERGFFHFQGLRPGAYELHAEQKGFVPLRSLPVMVVENLGTELPEPLVLTRPAELFIGVEPPADPRGEPWRLTLSSPSSTEGVPPGLTDEAGTWVTTSLNPGPYTLIVADSEGSRVASEEIVVEPPETEHWVMLSFVEVEGVVTLGDEPLAARLAFGGSSGMTSVSMQADDEGRFSGVLPRPGTWSLDVRSGSPRVFRRLRAVEVEPTAGSSRAFVEIELPGTRLEGEVVDAEGSGITGATILAVPVPQGPDDPAERPSFVRSEEGGLFVFEGFEPAVYRLQAIVAEPSGQKRQSEPVEVSLKEDDPFQTARLVIGRSVRFQGRILWRGTGVPGIAVLAQPRGSGTGVLVPSGLSGPDGRFELELPEGTASAALTVLAPGFLLYKQVVTVAGGEEHPARLEREGGGTLVIQPRTPVDFASGQGLPWVVRSDGVHLDMGTLSKWSILNQGGGIGGEKIKIPMMPAGGYQVCWPLRRRQAKEDRKPECHGGDLPAYGRLEITERRDKDEETPSEESDEAS